MNIEVKGMVEHFICGWLMVVCIGQYVCRNQGVSSNTHARLGWRTSSRRGCSLLRSKWGHELADEDVSLETVEAVYSRPHALQRFLNCTALYFQPCSVLVLQG